MEYNNYICIESFRGIKKLELVKITNEVVNYFGINTYKIKLDRFMFDAHITEEYLKKHFITERQYKIEKLKEILDKQ